MLLDENWCSILKKARIKQESDWNLGAAWRRVEQGWVYLYLSTFRVGVWRPTFIHLFMDRRAPLHHPVQLWKMTLMPPSATWSTNMLMAAGWNGPELVPDLGGNDLCFLKSPRVPLPLKPTRKVRLRHSNCDMLYSTAALIGDSSSFPCVPPLPDCLRASVS